MDESIIKRTNHRELNKRIDMSKKYMSMGRMAIIINMLDAIEKSISDAKSDVSSSDQDATNMLRDAKIKIIEAKRLVENASILILNSYW